MKYYTEELRILRNEIMEKERIKAKLEDLYIQQSELTNQSESLKKVMKEEQKDVDRLNKVTLSAFFYRATGKMDEKLTKEEGEAFAAAMKYESAEREIKAVNEDILYYEKRLLQLSDCEEHYQELMDIQKKEIISENTPEAAGILAIEEELTGIRNQEKEIHEAVDAGKSALKISREILDTLDSAKTWGTVDMIGGGIFSDIMKYDKLNEVKEKVGELQSALRSFRTELADVTDEINGNIDTVIGDFLHFADYVFDGFFTDWMVYSKIKSTIERATMTHNQIEYILERLISMKEQLQIRYEEKKEELDHMIVSI